MITVSQLPSRQ